MMMPELNAPERLLLASNPEAGPDVLSAFAADGNLQVRRAAATNPATPGSVLSLLTKAGAAGDLTGLKTSTASLTTGEVERLVSLGEFGRRLAARHPDTSGAVLETLAGDTLAAVRRAAAAHPRSSAGVLTRLCGDENADVRTAAAKNPGTPREAIERLVTAGSTADLSGYAQDESSPTETDQARPDFSAVIAAGPWGKRLAARHPRVDPAMLRALADDADWAVRAAVAENPSAGAALLENLADLDTFAVKLTVARHPAASAAVLGRIAAEPDTRLRVAVATNAGAPPELLRCLACDGSSAVRDAVAVHPGFADADRLELVAAGSSADLSGFGRPDASMAAAAIDALAELGDWARQLAARHPNTSSSTLEQLITSGDAMLRETALGHPAAPTGLLQLLADAGSSADLQGYAPPARSLGPEENQRLLRLGPWARRLLGRHADTPVEALRELAIDQDPQIRRAVACHPRADDELLEALAMDISHEVRWTLIGRETLCAAALLTLLRDSLATIRLAAVDHPRTPREALGALRFDLDEDVRAAVRDRLAGETPPR